MDPESGSGNTGAGGNAETPLTEQAKQQAQKVLHQTREKAGDALGQARDQVKTRLESQKDVAAEGLQNVALAMRQAGEHLREQEQAALSSGAEHVATTVENFSGYLRRTELDEFARNTERFARNQPALFLGAVFTLGFLAARFLRSSSPDGNGAPTNGTSATLALPAPPAQPDFGAGVGGGAFDTDMRATDDASSTTNF